MKTACALILFMVLTCSLMSPLSIERVVSTDSDATYVANLDVCHSGASPGSLRGDMPLFCELSSVHLFAGTAAVCIVAHSLSVPSAFSFPEEHPPRA